MESKAILEATRLLHVGNSRSLLQKRTSSYRGRSAHFIRNQRESFSKSGGSTSSERSRRVPPPPPPPPPPSGFGMPNKTTAPTLDRRQQIIGSGLLVAGVVAGLFSGVGGRLPSADYERELSYVASQVGVRGMPSPVSAVVDKISGRIVAVNVIGKSGQEYMATVNPKNPSVLVLKPVGKLQVNVRPGIVYRLPTRYDTIDMANRRQIETIFRVPNWESMMM